MSERLDLNVDVIEDIPGKIVEIAGAEYIFQELLAEGGQKFVYPLKNKKSGLILYVGKIFKFRPGTPELHRLTSSTPKMVFDLVHAGLALYTEIHDIPGAVMELQPYGATENPEYCENLVNSAVELQRNHQWSDAVKMYDTIIQVNQYHSIALLNKAICLLNMGEIQTSIELVKEAISIEPNYPEGYRLLSSIMLELGRPDVAIAPLEATLKRFKGDPKTWEALLKIAVDYDLVETAINAIKEVYALSNNPQDFAHFQNAIKESTERRRDYDKLISTAISLQMSSSWSEALSVCSEAMSKTKNNHLATINYFICKYHLANVHEIAEHILGKLNQWDEPSLSAAVILALLCCHKIGDKFTAAQLILWLSARYDHHVDIPSIPVGVTAEGALLEMKSATSIINILDDIEGKCSPSDVVKITKLKSLYLQRESAFHKK